MLFTELLLPLILAASFVLGQGISRIPTKEILDIAPKLAPTPQPPTPEPNDKIDNPANEVISTVGDVIETLIEFNGKRGSQSDSDIGTISGVLGGATSKLNDIFRRSQERRVFIFLNEEQQRALRSMTETSLGLLDTNVDGPLGKSPQVPEIDIRLCSYLFTLLQTNLGAAIVGSNFEEGKSIKATFPKTTRFLLSGECT